MEAQAEGGSRAGAEGESTYQDNQSCRKTGYGRPQSRTKPAREESRSPRAAFVFRSPYLGPFSCNGSRTYLRAMSIINISSALVSRSA
jgi:hypothetical protein